MEFWVKHPKYNIWVSRTGLLKGKRSERTPRKDRYGYLRINLVFNGKHITKCVHTLVVETFIGEIPKGYSVNHKDGNKLNNQIENLEIITKEENTSLAFKQGLVTLCMPITLDGKTFYSKREAERVTGIPRYKF